MRMVNVDKNIITKLRESGISDEMKSLELCDWLIIHEHQNRIIGVAGVSTIFHITHLQILPKYQMKGLGPLIYREMINEAKKRNYSFLSTYQEANNIQSSKIHEFHNTSLMFRIHFSKEKIMDVRFVAWNKKGKILEKFFRFFNSWFGMSILACMLKILQPLYPKLLGHFVDDGRYVLKPSIMWIIKNFEKINN